MVFVRMGMRVWMGVRVLVMFARTVAVLVSVLVLVGVLMRVVVMMVLVAVLVIMRMVHIVFVVMGTDACRVFSGQTATAIFTHYSISSEASSISRPARRSPLGL